MRYVTLPIEVSAIQYNGIEELVAWIRGHELRCAVMVNIETRACQILTDGYVLEADKTDWIVLSSETLVIVTNDNFIKTFRPKTELN